MARFVDGDPSARSGMMAFVQYVPSAGPPMRSIRAKPTNVRTHFAEKSGHNSNLSGHVQCSASNKGEFVKWKFCRNTTHWMPKLVS